MSIADYGFAIWETFYVTVLSTAFALVLGLPLGVLLVAGDKELSDRLMVAKQYCYLKDLTYKGAHMRYGDVLDGRLWTIDLRTMQSYIIEL